MDSRATAKYLSISPQKIRLVCDQVRGKDAYSAANTLKFMPQKGAGLVLKVLMSAIANAENNAGLNPSDMYISRIYADEGPRRPWRRFGARGRFKPIIRRTSHVTVILSEREEVIEEFEQAEVIAEPEVEEQE